MKVDSTCKKLGVAIVGGHTELTSAVTRPVLIGEVAIILVSPLSQEGIIRDNVGTAALEGADSDRWSSCR